MSNSLGPHGPQHVRLLSFTISQSLLRFTSIESVMISISSSATTFSSCPQSFLASGFFPMSWLFTSGGQSIVYSASASPVLPMNIQGWFPLGFTGLIALLSKGFSRVFSSTTIQKHILNTLYYEIYVYIYMISSCHPPASWNDSANERERL